MVKNPNKELSEQMGLSDQAIARRLHLLNFIHEDAKTLKKAQAIVEESLPEIIEAYYNFQLSVPEIASVIGDSETLRRLKNYMRAYVRSLFGGKYEEDYVNNRLRIGQVHMRLDVGPRIYLTAHKELQSLLDSMFERRLPADEATQITSALHKLLIFDARLVFDAYVHSYVEKMESVSSSVEEYARQVGTKLQNGFHELEVHTQKDSLTGLYQREAFGEFLLHELQVSERHNLSFILLFLDLNGFKAINDKYGHLAGDEVLAQVARSMEAGTRALDLQARIGGDEFCCILPRTTIDELAIPLKRITEHFDQNCSYPVTFSIGIVQAGPTLFPGTEELMEKADKLMYVAKQRAHQDGQHHWQFDDEGQSANSVLRNLAG